jgi:cytochrome c oxidase cbb3-type subunit 2
MRRLSLLAVPLITAFAAMVALPLTAQSPAPEFPSGQAVYGAHCVECHGTGGRGDGPAAHLLQPRPRDFTAGRYKVRTTESGSVPTDADLERSIREGLPGSAMPGWAALLSDAEIQAVIGYVKSLSPRFQTDTPQPVVLGTPVAASPDSVARGAVVYERLQCGKCHGSDGRGTDAVTREFQDDWMQPLSAADLTEPWTFHGGRAPEDIYLRFRTGMSGTPMPSFRDTATDAEMWDLANYVGSLARTPVWEMSAAEVVEFYARDTVEAAGNPVERGRYLVETLGCPLCHSPVDEDRRLIPGMRMAGGMRIEVDPFGVYTTGNLTSDPATGLGEWTDAEIKQVLTRGVLRDGTRLLPYPMDWGSFSTMNPSDLDAIVAYLRTIPPVSNAVPPPVRTFLPLYLWGKFRMLILGSDPPMTFYTGNAGQAAAGAR